MCHKFRRPETCKSHHCPLQIILIVISCRRVTSTPTARPLSPFQGDEWAYFHHVRVTSRTVIAPRFRHVMATNMATRTWYPPPLPPHHSNEQGIHCPTFLPNHNDEQAMAHVTAASGTPTLPTPLPHHSDKLLPRPSTTLSRAYPQSAPQMFTNEIATASTSPLTKPTHDKH